MSKPLGEETAVRAERQEASEAKPMNRTVHCYIQGQGNEWEAICVDFDLSVAGRSFDEVRASIEVAIKLYLETALQDQDRDRLLARRAPLWVRLQLAMRHIMVSLRRRSQADGSFHFPCPA